MDGKRVRTRLELQLDKNSNTVLEGTCNQMQGGITLTTSLTPLPLPSGRSSPTSSKVSTRVGHRQSSSLPGRVREGVH